jgi:hypothetical protein
MLFNSSGGFQAFYDFESLVENVAEIGSFCKRA